MDVHIGQLLLEGWSAQAGDATEFAADFTAALEEALGGGPAQGHDKAAQRRGAAPAGSAARTVAQAMWSAVSAAQRGGGQ